MANDSYFLFDGDNKMKTNILTNVKRDQLKIHSPMYCMKDNWGNGLNPIHTLNKIYLSIILYVQCFQINPRNDVNDAMWKETNTTFRSWCTQTFSHITYSTVAMETKTAFLGSLWSNWQHMMIQSLRTQNHLFHLPTAKVPIISMHKICS